TLELGSWLLGARILRHEHAQRTRHVERQQSAATQQPRRFGHGFVRVSEGRRAVIAEHDIEARIWQRDTLATGVHAETRHWQPPSNDACSNWRAELSRPTGRAPRRAKPMDHCAAPQPNSSISLPATSPSTCSSSSGMFQMPQAQAYSLG